MAASEPSQLVLPKASKDETPSQNKIVALAADYLQKVPQIGEPGVFNFTFTGFVIQMQPAHALFMATNRTGQTIENFAFRLHVTVNQEIIWENTLIKMSAEDFGELPDQASMPVLVSIPAGKEELLLKAKDEEIQLTLSHLQRL